MRRARRRLGLALFTLFAPALFGGACGKDETTALDIELTVSGTIDQIRIDDVTLDGTAVTLAGEKTLFPSSPGMLKTGDVLTVWFADSADT